MLCFFHFTNLSVKCLITITALISAHWFPPAKIIKLYCIIMLCLGFYYITSTVPINNDRIIYLHICHTANFFEEYGCINLNHIYFRMT